VLSRTLSCGLVITLLSVLPVCDMRSTRILPSPPSFPTRRSSDLVYHIATTMPRAILPTETVWLIMHRRWDIENSLFNDLKQNWRSEEHTSELQSREQLVCRLLLEKKYLPIYTS